MARKIMILIAALFLIIIGILCWQWWSFRSGFLQGRLTDGMVTQRITVENQANGLQISQLFENLTPNDDYQLKAPAIVSKWSCENGKGEPCLSRKQKSDIFQAQGGKLEFHFFIPVDHNKNSFMMNDWLMKLANVNVSATDLEIVGSKNQKGTWVASLPQKVAKQLKYIDFYAFAGKGGNPSLYWQQKPLYRVGTNKYLSYYSENRSEKIAYGLKNSAPFNNTSYLTIIHSNEHSAAASADMLIGAQVPSSQFVQEAWMKDYFVDKFGIDHLEDEWLANVFLSLATHQQADSPKGQFIQKQLNEKLDQTELQTLMEKTFQAQYLNTTELDQLIGNIKDLDTTFFSSNQRFSSKDIALTFFDRRPISVNAKLSEQIHPIKEQSALFFPFIETVKQLGYRVQMKQNQRIFLDKKGNHILFYINENRFIKNGQKYGLLETPFINNGGSLYINESGLQAIFHVSLIKTRKTIFIVDR